MEPVNRKLNHTNLWKLHIVRVRMTPEQRIVITDQWQIIRITLTLIKIIQIHPYIPTHSRKIPINTDIRPMMISRKSHLRLKSWKLYWKGTKIIVWV